MRNGRVLFVPLCVCFAGIINVRIVNGALLSERSVGRSLWLRGGASDVGHANEAFDPEGEDLGEEAHEAAQEETETTFNRLSKVKNAPQALRDEAKRDAGLIREHLLPGLTLNMGTQAWNAATLILGLTILTVYLKCVYKPDHNTSWDQNEKEHEAQHKDREEKELDRAARDRELAARVESEQHTMLFGLLSTRRFCKMEQLPDLILVLDNPGFLEKEGNKKGDIYVSALQTVLACEQRKRDMFPAIHDMFVRKGAVQEGEATFSPETLDVSLNKAEVIKALLQDIYSFLPGKGFDSDIFRSIDDKYLFVCITLVQDQWIDLYLRREGWSLPIQPKIVDELGLGKCEDPDALAPPYVRYDARTVKRLYDMEIIPEEDPRHVYQTHHGDGRRDYCVGRTDRLRIVLKEMNENINLGAAKLQGLLVEWYPVHSMHQLHRFGSTWAAFSKMLDLSFVQPIPKIHGYFGARMAFMFAWLGLYCKMLLPLSVVALLWQGGAITLQIVAGVENAKRQILGITLVVLVWSRISFNYWDREQEYFMKLFNLDGRGLERPHVRPEFKGRLIPSPSDSYVEELEAPPIETLVKRTVSKSITVMAIIFVAMCINLWFNIFEGRFNLLASVLLAVQIQIFQFLYNHLSLYLNEFENHQFESEFYDSLLWKRFAFGFVNSYWAFFYIAVKQRFTERGCRAGGCFIDLRNQLRMTLIILTGIQILMTVGQVAYVQLCLKWDQDKVAANKKRNLAKLRFAFIEVQSHYVDFGIVEQIAMMQQLAITLGYVILFGGVAPIIIPFCFAAFGVNLRSAAFLLVTSSKQVLPESSRGIGAWRDVVNILMDAAVLFTGFLLAVYSETFSGAQLIAKMTGIMIFCLVVFLMWRICDFFFKPTCSTTSALEARRARSAELLMDLTIEYPGGTSADAPRITDPVERRSSMNRNVTDHLFKDAVGDDDRAVAEGDWSSIPYVRREDSTPNSPRSPGSRSPRRTPR